MDAGEGPQPPDLLALFSDAELKSFFRRGLLGAAGLELVVVLVALGERAARSDGFPWKAYFLAAFTLPLLAVFLERELLPSARRGDGEEARSASA